MRPRFASILSLLLITFGLHAQPLADRLPADTMVYFGWQGAASPGAGYAGSHLQAVVEGSDLPHFVNEFLPQVAQLIAKSDPDAAEVMPLIAAVARPLWNYPSAFYFGGVDATGGAPLPIAAFLIDAGGNADKVLADLGPALDKAKGGGIPLTAKVEKGLVILAVGPAVPAALQASINGGNGLAADADFKAAMGQVPQQPAVALYVNVKSILATVDTFTALQPGVQPNWMKIRDAIGLAGLKAIAVGAGFDGKDWVTGTFVAAPAPRTGLLKMMEGEAVKDDFLKLVPKTSLSLMTARFRPSVLVDVAHAIVPMMGPDVPPVDAIMQQASGMLGFDIGKDLLAAFGDEWAVYTDPMIGGTGLVGTVLVHRTADGAKLEQSLGKLEILLNGVIASNMNDPKVTIAFKTQQVRGMTLHYLAVPFVTPTWAIRDGVMYVGLYPQTVVGAADFVAHKGPSILDNEMFQGVRKRLAVNNATSIQYMDLPRIVPDTYGPWVAVSRSVGFADIFGVNSPLMVMPPIQLILDNLSAAGQVTWTDDAGFHAKGVSPFPGSEILGTDLFRMYASEAPLMASVLMPSLSKSRQAANRVKSASNLRMIGQGCQLYANENRGKMPPDFGTELKTQDLFPDAFVSPLGQTQMPPDIATGTVDQKAAWVSEHSDYVYLGAGKTVSQLGPNDVVAYEKMDIARSQNGLNVLYGDGHVDWVHLSDFEKMVPNAK